MIGQQLTLVSMIIDVHLADLMVGVAHTLWGEAVLANCDT